jgi:hypothetical protein
MCCKQLQLPIRNYTASSFRHQMPVQERSSRSPNPLQKSILEYSRTKVPSTEFLVPARLACVDSNTRESRTSRLCNDLLQIIDGKEVYTEEERGGKKARNSSQWTTTFDLLGWVLLLPQTYHELKTKSPGNKEGFKFQAVHLYSLGLAELPTQCILSPGRAQFKSPRPSGKTGRKSFTVVTV